MTELRGRRRSLALFAIVVAITAGGFTLWLGGGRPALRGESTIASRAEATDAATAAPQAVAAHSERVAVRSAAEIDEQRLARIAREDADAERVELLRHEGATDLGQHCANGIVVRVVDPELLPVAAARVEVNPHRRREVGITDANGRIRTSIEDVRKIDAVEVTAATATQSFATRDAPTQRDMTGRELLVRWPAERRIALRFVEATGRPIRDLRIACHWHGDFAPEEPGMMLHTAERLEATTDADGLATFTAIEGLHWIEFASLREWFPCAWMVVARGHGTIEDTIAVHTASASRDVTVHVTRPAGITANVDVDVEAHFPYRVVGASGRVGRLDDLIAWPKARTEDGTTFVVRDLPGTPVQVKVSCDGCESICQTVPPTSERLDITLAVAPPRDRSFAWLPLRGTVLDVFGAPIANATVRLAQDADSRASDLVTTDAGGAFEFEWVCQRMLTVRHKSFATAIVGPLNALAPPTDLRIVLVARATLTGNVLDAHGGPAGGIPVFAWRTSIANAERPSRESIRVATTTSDGTFAFEDVAEGEYEVRARPAFSTGQRVGRAVVATGRPTTIVLGTGLDDDGTVTGRVVDAATGHPIVGARVSVSPATHSDDVDELWSVFRSVDAATDADGRFQCIGAPAGRGTVTVDAAGYAMQEFRGDPADLARLAARIELRPACWLRLRVLSSDDTSTNGLVLAIVGDNAEFLDLRDGSGQRYRFVQVATGGRANLSGVPRGRIRLVVSEDPLSPHAARHTFDIDTRSLGDELVDIVVPR